MVLGVVGPGGLGSLVCVVAQPASAPAGEQAAAMRAPPRRAMRPLAMMRRTVEASASSRTGAAAPSTRASSSASSRSGAAGAARREVGRAGAGAGPARLRRSAVTVGPNRARTASRTSADRMESSWSQGELSTMTVSVPRPQIAGPGAMGQLGADGPAPALADALGQQALLERGQGGGQHRAHADRKGEAPRAHRGSMILDRVCTRQLERGGGKLTPIVRDIYSVATMARPKRGEILSLTIDDLAFGGEGVGRADGYVVFVPGGLPGDRLRVRLVQVRSRFGRGVIDAIEEPSPQRVEAPCPYFGRCGGCRLQHMAYPAQLAFKAKQVVDALERLGGLKGIEVRPIIGATETFGYRNKMEFTVARGAKEPLVVGLHEADRYDSVLDIERCLLQSDRMNALLGEARAFFVERGLTVYEQDSGEGLLRFLMLREGTHTGELMANVVTSAPAVSELAPLAQRLQARDPGTTSVVMNVNPKKASVAVGVEEHLLGGRDHIREGVGGLTFQVSASSFFQTNTRQAERLFELVLDSAGLTGTETVYDLYSGTGAISLLLARRAPLGVRRRGGPGRGGRRGGATRRPTASPTARSCAARSASCCPP